MPSLLQQLHHVLSETGKETKEAHWLHLSFGLALEFAMYNARAYSVSHPVAQPENLDDELPWTSFKCSADEESD